MRYLTLFSLLCVFFACSGGSETQNDSLSQEGNTTEMAAPSVESVENFEELKQLVQKVTGDRDENGKINNANFPGLIQETIKITNTYPGDYRSRDLCFDVAEILKIGGDYENAEKMYAMVIRLFPKSDKVGMARFQLAFMQKNYMEETAGAIANFEAFIRDYPDHPAINIATQQLYQLTN